MGATAIRIMRQLEEARKLVESRVKGVPSEKALERRKELYAGLGQAEMIVLLKNEMQANPGITRNEAIKRVKADLAAGIGKKRGQ